MKLSYLITAIAILSLIACRKDRISTDTVNTVEENDYTICTDHWDEVNYEGVPGGIQFVYNNKYYEPENDGNQAGNNRVHVFDGSAWTVKNSTVPVNTSLPCIVFTISNKGYAADLSGPADGPIKFYEYNITTNTWTRKADFPGEARYGIASFSAGGKGYAVGGYHTEYGQNLEYPFTAQTWEYDPLLNIWTRKKSLTITRAQSVGFSVGNKGYITNGLFPVNAGYCESTLKYDPDTDEWTRVADYPGIGRIQSVSFTIGNYAYVGGGWHNSPREDFYKYNPSNDTWTRVDDIPITDNNAYLRHPFSINSKGYVSYGISGTNTQGLLKYTPTTCGYVFEPTTTTSN